MFYEDKLKTSSSVDDRDRGVRRTKKFLHFWPCHKDKDYVPLVFCHVAGEERELAVTTEQGNQRSKSNLREKDKVVSLNFLLINFFAVLTFVFQWSAISERRNICVECAESFVDILNFGRSIGDWKKYMRDKDTVAFLKTSHSLSISTRLVRSFFAKQGTIANVQFSSVNPIFLSRMIMNFNRNFFSPGGSGKKTGPFLWCEKGSNCRTVPLPCSVSCHSRRARRYGAIWCSCYFHYQKSR